MSPSTFELWLERPNLPTQQATHPNFHRAGSQETCHGNEEYLEGLEEKWQWFAKARAAKSSDELGMSAPASLLAHLLPLPGLWVTQGPDTTASALLQGYSSMQPSMQAGSQLLASHSLASLGFDLGDLFLLAPREKF